MRRELFGYTMLIIAGLILAFLLMATPAYPQENNYYNPDGNCVILDVKLGLLSAYEWHTINGAETKIVDNPFMPYGKVAIGFPINKVTLSIGGSYLTYGSVDDFFGPNSVRHEVEKDYRIWNIELGFKYFLWKLN